MPPIGVKATRDAVAHGGAYRWKLSRPPLIVGVPHWRVWLWQIALEVLSHPIPIVICRALRVGLGVVARESAFETNAIFGAFFRPVALFTAPKTAVFVAHPRLCPEPTSRQLDMDPFAFKNKTQEFAQ